jgi:hypothetical protein
VIEVRKMKVSGDELMYERSSGMSEIYEEVPREKE